MRNIEWLDIAAPTGIWTIMKHVTSQFKDNLVRKTHSKCLCTIDIWRLVIFWSYSSNEEIIAMQTWLRRSYIAKSMGCYFVERMDFGGRKRRARNMGLFNLSYLLFISKNPSKHPSMILIHNPSSSKYKLLLVVMRPSKKNVWFQEKPPIGWKPTVCFFVEGIFPRQIKRTDPLVEALDAVASAVWKAQQVEWMMDEIMHRLRLGRLFTIKITAYLCMSGGFSDLFHQQ